MIELSHRLAERIRKDLPLAVYMAIHDPAREEPGSVNRHLHVLVTTRGLGPVGFMRRKIRGLFARPRPAKAPNVHANYIAEGVHWPQVARELLESYFLELGLDLTIDPHLPVGHRHWSSASIRDEPERVEKQRGIIHGRNEKIVLGEALFLMDSMRRGRTTASAGEIRRILAPFIDKESDREFRLNQILADPEIITYSLHVEDSRATRLTTRAIHQLVTSATEIIMYLGARRAVPMADNLEIEAEEDEELRRPKDWSSMDIYAFKRDIEASLAVLAYGTRRSIHLRMAPSRPFLHRSPRRAAIAC